MSKTIIIKHSSNKYYEKMANDFSEEIKKQVKDPQIKLEEVEDFYGAFEVALQTKSGNKMIHSKLNTGKGITTENLTEIIKKINDAK